METKFTPGPWTISGKMTRFIEARIGGGWVQEVAAVGPTESDNGYGEQQEANAHLIAAAPDLFDALDSAAKSAGFQYMTHETQDAINAALAKARGEQ